MSACRLSPSPLHGASRAAVLARALRKIHAPVFERKLSEHSQSVGPQHDPYCRNFLSMYVNGVEITLRYCALCGLALFVDEHMLSECRLGDSVASIEKEWEQLTGLSPWRARRILDRSYEPDPMGSPSSYE